MNLSTTKQKGITATGSKATYTVTKTSKFDAKGFSKALETAKTTDSDYDRALDRFLKRNSSRYGYTYSVTRYQDTRRMSYASKEKEENREENHDQ